MVGKDDIFDRRFQVELNQANELLVEFDHLILHVRCSFCGGIGHVDFVCPSKTNANRIAKSLHVVALWGTAKFETYYAEVIMDNPELRAKEVNAIKGQVQKR